METINVNNQDYPVGYQDPENENNQQDYPDNGNESQTGGASDNEPLEEYDDNNLDDDDLAGVDDEVNEDESANDVDGNGGFADAANTTITD